MERLPLKILRVDLTKKKMGYQKVDETAKLFIGGSGLAPWILYNDLQPRSNPLNPNSEIIFSVGPLVGSGLIGGNRTVISGKSPLSGTYCHCHGGGFFGAELRGAGWSHIVITGRSEKPAYLMIEDESVEIKDAEHLWGKTISEADEMIKEENGDKRIKTAIIGPAGENLCRYACFMLEKWNAPAGGGMGCIAGSKKLKAIAVRGTKKVPVADSEGIKNLNEQILQDLEKAAYAKMWKEMGSIFLIYQNYVQGVITAKNYQESNWAKASLVSPFLWTRKYRVRGESCFACPIACKGVYEVKDGPFKGVKGKKVDFGHITQFASLLDISDYGAICYLQNLISSELGMDVKELGHTLSMAMECYQRGVITKEDTNGIALEWGNVEAVIEMIKMIAYRKGFGNVLAEGVKRAAESIGKGAKKYAMHVKGMALDGVDTRVAQSWALGHAVGTRPDHLAHFEVFSRRGDKDFARKLLKAEESADMYSPVAKGRTIWWAENYKALVDALGLCAFITNAIFAYYPLQKISQMYTAVTGIKSSEVELFTCAERIVQVEKAFNAREGFSKKDDRLPWRLTNEPAVEGPGKGKVACLDYHGMLDEYYEYRGLSTNGLPTKDRLYEVGLHEIADDLMKNRKISVAEQKVKFKELTHTLTFSW